MSFIRMLTSSSNAVDSEQIFFEVELNTPIADTSSVEIFSLQFYCVRRENSFTQFYHSLSYTSLIYLACPP